MNESRFSAALGDRDDEDRRRVVVADAASVASLRADGNAGLLPVLFDMGDGGLDRI